MPVPVKAAPPAPAKGSRLKEIHEKLLKFITQQLVLLTHAQNCKPHTRRDWLGNAEIICSLPYCRTMRNLLMHIRTCHPAWRARSTDGKYKDMRCKTPHCRSSRTLISHAIRCKRNDDCWVCRPVKEAFEHNNPHNPFIAYARRMRPARARPASAA